MPAASAASVRDFPSMTSANASIRRDPATLDDRRAARRNPAASNSSRVILIATAMLRSTNPGPEQSESRQRRSGNPARVSQCGRAYYTPRERAALAWTEALTRIAETHAPDDVYAEVCRHFSDKEMADLTVAIGMINLWNRVSIAFRTEHMVEARPRAA
jgi:alkylhydroperoxidase family enzyme